MELRLLLPFRAAVCMSAHVPRCVTWSSGDKKGSRALTFACATDADEAHVLQLFARQSNDVSATAAAGGVLVCRRQERRLVADVA